ncbi:MAG: phosphoethanolamine--lipid A transferase [Tepidimonas sp.]|uniref:phosphoethanolamine transferase n=1 Tax=Tepidimonas sp. TaxID=2002775 RepID=UPI00298F0C68|nr:phosphoethanolamine--lipid A transferase [Tepidimonas sp.]MDW8335943.1 phosphoethanolamine--lipid A transferase [Tepidimonas sp.]
MQPRATGTWERQRRGWSVLGALVVLAAGLATLGNGPLWLAVLKAQAAAGVRGWVVALAWMAALTAVNVAWLALLAVGPLRRPLGVALLILCAASSYFMFAYGIVIDASMAANVFNTDWRETRELLTPGWVVALLVGAVLPGWWWWRLPVRSLPWRQAALGRAVVALAALLLATGLLWLTFQDLAALMRNDRSLRFLINPYNSFYATLHHSMGQRAWADEPPQPIGLDAQPLPPAPDEAQAPLVVLVVGETARAANVALGGYPRDTTPRLRALQAAGQPLVYFDRTQACGTNTQTSVPCLFAPQGGQGWDPARRQENLLDLLQRVGVAVTWLDNQSGCKGVCARVPTRQTDRLEVPGLCDGQACYDEILLRELPAALQALPEAARRVGTLAVLHMMGSHGPAYHKRTPAAFKRFLPECTTAQLQACDGPSIVNAYDNTIVYTDHVLAELIEWLARRQGPSALLYVSDHGESLGEGGLYLHGMPYALAPREQKEVPMLLWLNAPMQQRLGLSAGCLPALASTPATHDHVFHTVAGLFGVRSQVVQRQRDLLAGCRRTG